MKLPKKVYLVAAILLFAAGGGTVYALQPEPATQKEDTVQLTNAITEPEAPIQQEVAVEQPIAPAPAPQAVEPEPQPKTVAELKSMATNWILQTNKCGVYTEYHPDCPPTQAKCFIEGIQLAYGWDTVDETFIMNKLQTLHDKYTGMCPGLGELKKRGNDPKFF